jgi:transcriptional regulator with XRE-family HTH domain
VEKRKMSLGSNIKSLRTRHKLSLQDVADSVGASKAHIWDLERGASKNPSMELLIGLAKTFKVSVAELIGEPSASDVIPPDLVALYHDLKELGKDDIEVVKRIAEGLKAAKESKSG